MTSQQPIPLAATASKDKSREQVYINPQKGNRLAGHLDGCTSAIEGGAQWMHLESNGIKS